MHRKASMLRMIGVGLVVVAADSRPRLRMTLEKRQAYRTWKPVNARRERQQAGRHATLEGLTPEPAACMT